MGSTASETAFVDIYYGDEMLESLLATYDDTRLRLETPQRLIPLLPALRDTARAKDYFSGELRYQAPSQCNPRNIQQCFDHSGTAFGVSFDPETFALHIFIAAEALEVSTINPDRYLPPFRAEPSYLADIGVQYAVSDSALNARQERYNATLYQVVSVGNQRLQTELGQTDAGGFYAREIAYVREHQRERLTLGRYQLTGDRLLPSRLVQGIGLRTTTDLRVDLDQNGGSRLELFLPQRSRVEIYRNDRLLSTAYYDIGNQQLDVSDLPDGSYEIEIRVLADGLITQTERRFFTKSTRLPPVGENHLGFDLGRRADPLQPGAEKDSEFVRFTYAHRLNDPGYLEFNSFSTAFWTSAQLAYHWLQPDFFGDVAIQQADDGYRAAALSGSYRRGASVLGLDWARVSAPAQQPLAVVDFRRAAEDTESATLRYSVAQSRWTAQLALRLNQTPAGSARLFSLSGSWLPLSDSDQLRLSTTARHSELAGWQATVDVLWRLPEGPRRYWARTRWTNRDDRRVQAAVGLSGHQGNSDASLRYELSAEQRSDSQTLLADTYYQNPYFRGSTAYGAELDGNRSRALSSNLRTAFSASRRGLTVFGGAGLQSGVVVSLPAQEAIPVTVIVNDSRRIAVEAGGSQFIPLRAYERYRIRVQAQSAGDLEFDTAAREVVLYPGHVPVLEWQSVRVIPVFGQLALAGIDADEEIEVKSSRGWDRLTNHGYFAVDVASDSPRLQLRRNGELLCEHTVALDAESPVVDLGRLGCE